MNLLFRFLLETLISRKIIIFSVWNRLKRVLRLLRVL